MHRLYSFLESFFSCCCGGRMWRCVRNGGIEKMTRNPQRICCLWGISTRSQIVWGGASLTFTVFFTELPNTLEKVKRNTQFKKFEPRDLIFLQSSSKWWLDCSARFRPLKLCIWPWQNLIENRCSSSLCALCSFNF